MLVGLAQRQGEAMLHRSVRCGYGYRRVLLPEGHTCPCPVDSDERCQMPDSCSSFFSLRGGLPRPLMFGQCRPELCHDPDGLAATDNALHSVSSSDKGLRRLSDRIDGAVRIYVADFAPRIFERLIESLVMGGQFVSQFERVFASTGNHRIVRIDDMTGAGWTTFGTLGSGVNQFRAPFGIFVR